MFFSWIFLLLKPRIQFHVLLTLFSIVIVRRGLDKGIKILKKTPNYQMNNDDNQ